MLSLSELPEDKQAFMLSAALHGMALIELLATKHEPFVVYRDDPELKALGFTHAQPVLTSAGKLRLNELREAGAGASIEQGRLAALSYLEQLAARPASQRITIEEHDAYSPS
jgi:hypothetical protein